MNKPMNLLRIASLSLATCAFAAGGAAFAQTTPTNNNAQMQTRSGQNQHANTEPGRSPGDQNNVKHPGSNDQTPSSNNDSWNNPGQNTGTQAKNSRKWSNPGETANGGNNDRAANGADPGVAGAMENQNSATPHRTNKGVDPDSTVAHKDNGSQPTQNSNYMRPGDLGNAQAANQHTEANPSPRPGDQAEATGYQTTQPATPPKTRPMNTGQSQANNPGDTSTANGDNGNNGGMTSQPGTMRPGTTNGSRTNGGNTGTARPGAMAGSNGNTGATGGSANGNMGNTGNTGMAPGAGNAGAGAGTTGGGAGAGATGGGAGATGGGGGAIL